MSRTLLPREHGAYVQLLAPLAVALALRPSVAGALLAAGAVAAFFAHEPLLVLRGRRGRRARVELAERARRRLVMCAVAAVAATLVGVVLAPEILGLAAAVGIATVAVLALSWLDEAHTLIGEIAAAVALAGASGPVAVAGGMTESAAIALWATWALAFASTVVAVHAVIANHRRRATLRAWLVWTSLLIVCGAGLAIGSLAAGLPLWLTSVALTIVRPRATLLRRVGILLAVTAAVTAGWLIAASDVPGTTDASSGRRRLPCLWTPASTTDSCSTDWSRNIARSSRCSTPPPTSTTTTSSAAAPRSGASRGSSASTRAPRR